MDTSYVLLSDLAHERGTTLRDEAAAERLARTLRRERTVTAMTTATRADAELAKAARKRVERVRAVRLRTAVFALGMLVLGPVWAVSQYLESGGWPERLSPNGNPGDWSPWLIWVALAWAFYVAVGVLALHFRRPPDGRELARELRRLAPPV